MQDSVKKHSFSVFSVVLGLIVLGVSLYPAFHNYKYNNHSKNWLNHDYGKNLLSSTEQNSVFMTEGGDNQVFSSLYFTYAEKLRQDLFPYDQKGNIFKRIYGDLRYVTYDVLKQREGIVNKGLFNGQEPFYNEIRTSKPPYLVPYAQGKPSVYLTWQLDNPQNLGDFYYKNYGQMYKVQDIPYAIVDRLEVINSESIDTMKQYIQKLLGNQDIATINSKWEAWISRLEDEKLIKRQGNNLVYLKSYPKPFVKDPKESYIRRWDQIDNLKYYDYLSREIVISFAYEQINFLADEIDNDLTILDITKNAKSVEKLNTDITNKWDEITNYLSLIEEIGYDSSATLHNLGIFYINAYDRFPFLDKRMNDRAISFWQQGLKVAPYAWSTYSILLWYYMKEAFSEPAQAEMIFKKFDETVTTMTNNMTHFKSMKDDITKSKQYKQVEQLISMRDNFYKFSGPELIKERDELNQMVNTEPNKITLPMVQSYFTKMVNQLNFIDDEKIKGDFYKLWLNIWAKTKNNPEFRQWNLQLAADLSAYGNVIDSNIFKTLASEGATFLPKNPTTQQELGQYILVYRIAIASKDVALISRQKQALLIAAKRILSVEQYQQLEKQL